MMSNGYSVVIRNAINLEYDRHVRNLLRLPEIHIKEIRPNETLPLPQMLRGFISDTGGEIERYGNAIEFRIQKLIERLALRSLDDRDKNEILNIMAEFCGPDLYMQRFDIFLDIVDRQLERYGQHLERGMCRIDIFKSSNDAMAHNKTREILRTVSNELDALVAMSSNQKAFTREDHGVTKWFAKMNNIQRNQPFIFWFIMFVIAVISVAIY